MPGFFFFPPDIGVILGLVTDITLDDIMCEEIRGGGVVDSPVAVAMLMDT